MDRRDFIRLIGGGVVLAAVPAGCAAPAIDARAAWANPGAGETDPRKRALSFAILAPNPHNMQPWLADLREPNVVTLYVDRTRLLPVTDPFNRQIVIGCGGFLELLRMAAAEEGLTAEITPFPLGESQPLLDDKPVARVVFSPGGVRDPLFAHVLQRRTARTPFLKTPLEADKAARIAAATIAGVAASSTVDPARVATLAAIALEGADIEAATPAAHRESADRTFFGAQEVAAHRYGISIEGPAIEAAKAAGLLSQDKMATPGTFAYQQSVDFAKPLTRTAKGFIWLTTATNTRADQIAAGRAYMRINTKAAAEGVSMHPWSQGLQEYPTMANLYKRIHAVLAPQGGRVQMFVRVGYAKPIPPAPRRGLAQNLKA